ncbi:MAG: hypothetical protein IPP99_03050 [Chitinophagaceae bacterium]|nr:hypothetical protein [Chitinophagaceae bacterium]
MPQMLHHAESLPPGAIAKIEIVCTPSAKYDAQQRGIVNVVLKKGVKIGMTGSILPACSRALMAISLPVLPLNNNDGKKSSSINLNYSKRNSFERIRTNRIFAPDSLLFQDANTIYPGDTYFGSYSLVFPAGKKWDIDFATGCQSQYI